MHTDTILLRARTLPHHCRHTLICLVLQIYWSNAISYFIFWIACAGFRPLGQVLEHYVGQPTELVVLQMGSR